MPSIRTLFPHRKEQLSVDQLVQEALNNKEGVVASNFTLVTETGSRTGRSPKDRFIVKDTVTADVVNWGAVNQAIDADTFETLWQKAVAFLSDKAVYVSDLSVGQDEEHHLPVTVITELAWHTLFVNNLFIREKSEAKESWTLINAANLKTQPAVDGVNSDAAVMIEFSTRRILVCGTHYAGEMKKAMFSVLNFLLTEHDVLPMHCAANMGPDGDVALFFGLSGTGKTTLSSDPNRYLIGDDEHGWSEKGVFNFEGGCYAKCINLSAEKEPVIWAALKHGAVMENVVLNEQNDPVFDDASLTQNTRAAYPRTHIEKRVGENKGRIPKAVVFLCCDLYGVLPAVSRLTHEQAAYYFLSGYTALVGSTEVGQSEPIKPTFSTCFGEPFFPRPAQVYADLLIKRVQHAACPVYLVNTGWVGGAYGQGGERFDIPVTRAVVDAILSGDIEKAEFDHLPGFNLAIPKSLPALDSNLLDPRKNYGNISAYEENAAGLIEKFQENFKKFNVSDAVLSAQPDLVNVTV
ncbi:MAG: phosphoenolpyruvate carboxykinase (ATP) [Gammaproteobacteria bacterium CG11_big_fil_rev_8_21_14_0_20_46_22]|nr:MAG: phosphoenolpyruvate carboxykinase (ATP) [Gammaproteobacteria bacterium CG12_big_fil_rev_8_21_14_0_65_46_12]PIR10974.1 MAG: phosphoenolpyruvate carboxykinase (ATP) [Gammaproteobacteria bacterium CG11_big_fil_rev_8_21_14_0_20_46_22]